MIELFHGDADSNLRRFVLHLVSVEDLDQDDIQAKDHVELFQWALPSVLYVLKGFTGDLGNRAVR